MLNNEITTYSQACIFKKWFTTKSAVRVFFSVVQDITVLVIAVQQCPVAQRVGSARPDTTAQRVHTSPHHVIQEVIVKPQDSVYPQETVQLVSVLEENYHHFCSIFCVGIRKMYFKCYMNKDCKPAPVTSLFRDLSVINWTNTRNIKNLVHGEKYLHGWGTCESHENFSQWNKCWFTVLKRI